MPMKQEIRNKNKRRKNLGCRGLLIRNDDIIVLMKMRKLNEEEGV